MEKRILRYTTVMLLSFLCWGQLCNLKLQEAHQIRAEEILDEARFYVKHPIHPLIRPNEWIYKWNQVSAMWNNFTESDSVVLGYAYGKPPGEWVKEFEKEYCSGVPGCQQPTGTGSNK